LDVIEHHEGLVVAIAFESVVKLLSFLAVGIFVTYGIYDGFGDVSAKVSASPKLSELFTTQGAYTDWAWFTFLSMMAIFFLPCQF
jgi:Na+/proline symporter